MLLILRIILRRKLLLNLELSHIVLDKERLNLLLRIVYK